jgi:hypothetical protein
MFGGEAMATTIRPRGKMTKPLTTPYDVGDVVMLTTNDDPDDPDSMTIENPRFQAGDVGIIRKIELSDGDGSDGNATFLMFDVMWFNAGRRMLVGADEMKPAARADAYRARAFEKRVQRSERPSRRAEIWLRKQFNALPTN